MAKNDFNEKVYKVVDHIPAGRVTSYGAIAGFIGVKSGARMVGYALNQLADQPTEAAVPAHRVVNRLGQLTGRAYFGGDAMRERLEQEGVTFSEDYTVDMEKHFWDPSIELNPEILK
ncbi:MGMT family protein [Rhodohalobacter barkolensis]|uniref:6-O-methylguanine DNA methyltransferase n=1 Tax=Rhodohalobacter barkolensis TaxID=2053187 RepID=A0A2N0VKL0_9BACT|nr:MGMT family protein [Rhodohalobacter barkolensis]PKD44691.1 6-O-methylguanine DNA methyltransferase [Rhodohalobacter barkolensis]